MLPLTNIKVVELAGLAPVPLVGMILRDHGARVIRVDRIKSFISDEILNRGKESVCLDLKQPLHVQILRRLIGSADVLLDPYRPGVLEKLSLTPSDLQKENPGLIVARLSGYGQVRVNDSENISALRRSAGHDINYLAMSGLLSCLGPQDCPQAPMNLVADFGAGAMSCVSGVLMALLSRASSGQGQVIDCSMTLACTYVGSFFWRSKHKAPFLWPQPNSRAANVLDGGAPFYRCYRTLDKKFVAVGAIEPQFYLNLLRFLGLSEKEFPQGDVAMWPSAISRFSEIFASRSQQHWVESVRREGGDCCLTPVLSLQEAADLWDQDFVEGEGFQEPGSQPRLSEDGLEILSRVQEGASHRPRVGEHTETILSELGCDQTEIDRILALVKARI